MNTRLLLNNQLEGIGWFSYNILKILATKYPEHTFYYIFDRPYDQQFIFGDNVIPVVVSPPARHPILWYVWYEWSVARVLKKIKADVFLSMDSYTSIGATIPKITVIHDIAFVFFERQMPRLTQWYMRYFTPKFIESSDLVVTVSESTKNDMMSYYHTPESKIIVANNASSPSFQPMSEQDILRFKSEKTNQCDYFVYVGSIHPRKNVLNLLKAFEIYKNQMKDKVKLVLIGRFAWQSEDVSSYYESMMGREDVIFISHSSQSEISQWLAASLALVYVPLYEGFGIPLVEAMASHTPIICSDVSSMPEVVGDAGILVDCLNPFEIAQAMKSYAQNDSLRQEYILKGIERSKKYTWEHAANKIWEAIKMTLEHSR